MSDAGKGYGPGIPDRDTAILRSHVMDAIETEQRTFARRYPERNPYDYYNNFLLHLYDDSKSVHLGQRGIVRTLDLWNVQFRNHPEALQKWSAKKKGLTPAEFYREIDEVVQEVKEDSSIPADHRLTDADLSSLVQKHSGPGSSPKDLEKLYSSKLSEVFIRLRIRGYNLADLTQ